MNRVAVDDERERFPDAFTLAERASHGERRVLVPLVRSNQGRMTMVSGGKRAAMKTVRISAMFVDAGR